MRAISLWQPWATAVAIGIKPDETRHWTTAYRGELAIHAAKHWTREEREFAAVERALGRLPARLPLGAIVAVVQLMEVAHAAALGIRPGSRRPPMADIRQTIGLPPNETVEFFRAKGYRTQAHWDETWQAEHNRAFTVTKLLDRSLLEDVRGSLDKVLSQGGTFEMWKADIVPKMQAAGWYGKVQDKEKTGVDHAIFIGEGRLRTIYDTNLRVSRAAGQWKRIQALKAVSPYLMWDAIKDRRTRPLHRLWGGLDNGRPIILPVDHPAWAIYYPPCGWGCRCGVIQLSEASLKRRNLRVTSDEELRAIGWLAADGTVGGGRAPWRRSDGTVEMVPAGIDPGFAYNPGIDFMHALTPPPLAGPLPVPAIRPKPLPPMPEPRERPASVLLDPDTPADEAVDAFLAHFPGKAAAGAIATTDTRFVIDGKTRDYVVVTDFGEGGWRGVTAFKNSSASYRDGDQIRGGVLVYRRT